MRDSGGLQVGDRRVHVDGDFETGPLPAGTRLLTASRRSQIIYGAAPTLPLAARRAEIL